MICHPHNNGISYGGLGKRMRRKLFRVGMAWRLLVALILALCLVPIGSSPVAALDTVSVGGYFEITYEPVEFSKTEINGSEIFYATVEAEAACTNDLPLTVSEARIIGCVTATHQVSGAKVTLKLSYTVTISSFPNNEGETSSARRDISLQFPEESQSGTYTVVGELIKAEVNILIIGWLTVTPLLPEFQPMGSVTYVAPGGGDGFPPPLTPTAEEVKTNLFGTEASSPISSSGEMLETIEATSEDGTLTLTIREGTIALDKDDNPLISLEAAVDETPPKPPEDTSIIGLAYDFGPDGATFDSPITLTWSYAPNDIPDGVAEEDLVLAWYDAATDNWVELVFVVDTRNNTITASIEHFTTFAIIGAAAPPEPAPIPVPAIFTPSSLSIFPIEVNIGNEVTISLLVTNTGGKSGSYQVTLKINGEVAVTKEVTVNAGFSKEVAFTTSKDMAGTYLVDVNGVTDSFVVREAAATPEPESESESESESEPALTSTPPPMHTSPPVKPINWPVVCGVVAAVVAMGSLLFFLARRSHTKSSS
ncbi:hypothetical protein ES703_48813 [subsurface metagenome]